MPIHPCQHNGKSGYQWGKSGKCYTGKGARARARRQERAIRAHGYTGNVHNARNPLRADPSRTATLRRQFETELRKRFAKLAQDIRKLVAEEDVFGLRVPKPFTFNAQYSSTQADVTCPTVLAEVKRLQGLIAPEDLIEFEEDPHITIRYGLHTDEWQKVDELIQGNPRFNPRVGQLGLFHADEFEVLKFAVESPALDRMHHWLGNLPHTDTHANYNPHITVAYVKPGTGWKYATQFTNLVGHQFTVDRIKFSTPARVGTYLALNQSVANQRWRFRTDPEKLAAFQDWLRQEVKENVLPDSRPTDIVQDQVYWERYVNEGFRKGAGRAFDDTRKAATKKKGPELDFYRGSKEQFLRSSFGRPESISKVKLLASRTFTDLKGVTESMSTRMTRTLTDGLVQGKHPNAIAKDLVRDVGIEEHRAEAIARTEIMRAHAEGALAGYEELGVEEIGVMVEWSTAGDDRVCPLCEVLEGMVLTVQEAHGMFPRHPNCRCTPIPANVGEATAEQIRGKSRVEAAITRSVKKEGGTKRSSWIGKSKRIGKRRPTPVVKAKR